MIIPIFEVKQDEEFVTVEMRVPHLKVSSFDFYIDKTTFKFYGKPYFLRLVFTKELVEDGREKASYDVSTGLLTVNLPKKIKGEDFEDLDLLTLLKAKPNNKIPIMPIIEQMTSNPTGDITLQNEETSLKYDPTSEDNVDNLIDFVDKNKEGINFDSIDDLFDWDYPQTLPVPISSTLKSQYPYGFNLSYTNYFEGLQEELLEIIDLEDPNIPIEKRQELRCEAENRDFNEDHYLCDFTSTEEIQEIIQYEPFWSKSLENPCSSPAFIIPSSEPPSVFNDEEKEVLRQMKNKEFLVNMSEERALLLGLVDIIFAFVYDHLATMGDPTVESSWTITKLSATLSHLVVFDTIAQTLISCFRRSLTYPLYCNWELSQKVLFHTKLIFKRGKRHLLKSLIAIKKILQYSDFKYHLNNIFIDDYCVWIQSVKSSSIKHLSKKLSEIDITKEDIGWDLASLELLKDDLVSQGDDGDTNFDDAFTEMEKACILWVDLIGTTSDLDYLLQQVTNRLRCSIFPSIPHLAYQTLKHANSTITHLVLSYNDNVNINTLMETANQLYMLRPNTDLYVLSYQTASQNRAQHPPPSYQSISVPNMGSNLQSSGMNTNNASYLSNQPTTSYYNTSTYAPQLTTTQQAQMMKTFGIWVQSIESLIESLSLSIPRKIDEYSVIWPNVGDRVSSDQLKMFYTIGYKLAEGNYAVVHRCTDFFNQEFVVKIQKTKQSKDKIEKNWKSEKKLMLSVNHPNVIKLYDAFIYNNLYYYVLEKAEGTLREKLEKGFIFNFPEIVDFSCQILSGLCHIHHKQIIHRDLQKNINRIMQKVDNILWKYEGNRNMYKISDFGISRKIDSVNATAIGTTGRGWEVAPELLKFGKAAFTSDIYQFGIVLYHIITRVPVIEGNPNEQEYKAAVLAGVPQHKAKTLDSPLKYFLVRCLEPDPNLRYPSAYEAYRDLSIFISNQNSPNTNAVRNNGFSN